MSRISNFFRVTTRINTGGVPTQNFGIGLLITTGEELAAGGSGKALKFSDILAVAETFDSGSDPYKAAAAWFSQDPAPKSLYIGRWATTDVATTLESGTPGSVADLRAVTAGSFIVGSAEIDGLSLSTPATYTAIAAAIQVAILAETASDARLVGSTFTYDAAEGKFVLELNGAQDLGNGYFSDAATGTALAALLGMDQASDPVYRVGSDEEGVADCVDTIVELVPDSPYFIMIDGGVPATVSAVDTVDALNDRAEASGGDLYHVWVEKSAAARVTGDTTSPAYAAFSAQQQRQLMVYSKHEEGLEHVSAAALYSAQNFDQPNTVITGMGKTLPGELASVYTDTEYAELTSKRLNLYLNIGGLPTFVEGWTPKAGVWADARIWLDWIQNELELSLWNLVRSSPKIPATAYGIAQIIETLTTVMDKGVRNGGIGPGLKVSPTLKADIRTTTGNLDFDGVLTKGYLIHVGRLSEQSQTDRDSRLSPPIKIWAKGSSAIHRANVDLIFEN